MMSNNSGRDTAIAQWGEYLRFCVDNTSLANGRGKVCSNIWQEGNAEDSRYLWFVAYTLWVLQLATDHLKDEGYKASVVSILGTHKAVLEICWEKHWQVGHSDAFKAIVSKVIGPNNA